MCVLIEVNISGQPWPTAITLVCVSRFFCIVQVTLTLILRRYPSHDNISPAMIYTRTSSPHDCQCKLSISLIKVTYGEHSCKLMCKFDVYFRNFLFLIKSI